MEPNQPVQLNPQPSKKSLLIKIIIGLLAIAAIIAIANFAAKDSPKEVPQPEPTSQTKDAKVTISANGFEPESIEVPVGTQVTWTNADTKPHQVAADPYPRNNSIPGFDSSVVLNKNESLTFKFEKAGTYTYHDQLKPKIGGTIVVE